MMRVDGAELFPAAPEVQADASDVVESSKSSAADQKLVDALMRLMADERIYRHDNVTHRHAGDQARRSPNTGCGG